MAAVEVPKREGLHRFFASPITLWVVACLFIGGGVVRSQQIAVKAQDGVHQAARTQARQQAVIADQQQTIAKLSALVEVECSRSTTGAAFRNALIDTVTQHDARQRAYLRALGDSIPKVPCG